MGPVERNLAIGGEAPADGDVIHIGGVAYEHGIGVHAYSHARIGVYGLCQTFHATVGVGDQSAANQTGTVVFTVQADGQPVFEEGLSWQSGARDIDLPIAGVQVLDMIVTDAGDGIEGDAADWANARLEGCTNN